jgi:transposase
MQSKGLSRAGVTTKLHLAITAEGHVIEGLLTGGNKADISVAEELTAEIVGCFIVGDKGYDSDRYRAALRSNNNIPVIPGRNNRKVRIEYDKAKYGLRKRIEFFFARLKENRRLAVRYEKSDIAFLSFIAFASMKLYLC